MKDGYFNGAVVLLRATTSFLQHNMAGHSFFAALLVAVHSFSPAIASDLPSTITIAPEARQTPYDLAKRQAFTTYETTSALPLTQYIYPFDEIPYQVNPYMMGRGPQLGTNQCNSSTEGPNSLCQTIMMNNIVCSNQYLVILKRS